MAKAILQAEGIPIVAEDVDGERGRKLIFQTHDGAAWVRSL
jgi:chemotaxis receptor (MCP) glutamine deamidase CheD